MTRFPRKETAVGLSLALLAVLGLLFPVWTLAREISPHDQANSLATTEYGFPCEVNLNGNWNTVRQKKGFTTNQQLLDDINNNGRFGHRGTWPQIDLNANPNNTGPRTYGICESTTIHAAKNGTVSTFQWEGEGGYVLKINHGGQTSVYAHMPANGNHVSPGTPVSEGQAIGVMGCTGVCSGIHVHFAVDGSGGNWKFRLPDSTAPHIAFSGPAIEQWYNTDQQVSWSVSDAGSGVRGFKQAWDGEPNSIEYATANGWLSLAAAGEGKHTVRVRAWDNAGNQQDRDYGWLGFDKTNPSGHIAEPINGSATNTPSWTLRASAADSLSGVKHVIFYAHYNGAWYQLCTDTAAPYACAWSLPSGVVDQDVTFSTHISDHAGNTAFDPGGYRVVAVDRRAPTGSLALNNGWASADGLAMPLNLAADGTGSAVREVRTSADGINWSAWQPMASAIWIVLSGQHGGSATAYAQYKDAAGNVSTPVNASIALNFYPARPRSANYSILKAVQASGGGGQQSPGYRLNGTVGQPIASSGVASPAYRATWGYWPAQ